MTYADAGNYTCLISNAAGSTLTREATLIVEAPKPITFSSRPSTMTRVEGESLSLYVSVDGSPPMTYQWMKDGQPLPQQTYNSLSLQKVTLADAGVYTLVATNPAGAVTSPPATVVIQAAVKPTIVVPLQTQTVAFGARLNLSVQASGSAPFTYVWLKDGVSLNASSSPVYSYYAATSSQQGSYSVTVSNAAGSATSGPVHVTVEAPVLPTITVQPISQAIAVGLPFSLTVNYDAAGAGAVSLQWYRNDVPVANGNNRTLTLSAITASDAGGYRAVVTGDAGSVSSTTATLTVLLAAPPSVSSWPSSTIVKEGQSTSFRLNGVVGSPPITYQWYKDGVLLPGATSNALPFSGVLPKDTGTYSVTVSNPGGIIASPGLRLRVGGYSTFGENSTGEPWLAAERRGDVVYFLATVPARIERYDLAAESWMPTVYLGATQVPSAFAVAEEGVYVAYGRSIARRSADLATETPITNVPASITHLFIFGDYLYYAPNGGGGNGAYNRINRTTGESIANVKIGTFSEVYRHVSFAPSLRKGFARNTGSSPADIESFLLAADGSASDNKDSPYHGMMPVGRRTYVFPGDRLVADDGGTVYYTSDLTYAGSFGEGFDDLAFDEDGTVMVLRGTTLSRMRSGEFVEAERAKLPYQAFRVWARQGTAYAFGTASGTDPYTVTKVAATDFTVPAPAAAANGAPYSIEDAFLGEGDIVFVLSRSQRALLRWDPSTRRFLAPLPLRSTPQRLYHQPGNARALIAYPDGVITEVRLSAAAPSERALVNFGHSIHALVDLGDMFTVNFDDAQDSGDNRLIFTGKGPSLISTNLYNAPGLAWVAPSRRLYSTPAFSGTLQYETIEADGTLVPSYNPPRITTPVTAPLRFNADFTLVAAMNGRIHNADLATVGVLSNSTLDAAWAGNSLYTLRDFQGQAEVQRWAPISYLAAGSVTIPGLPLRLLRLSDGRFLVVSNLNRSAKFTLVNADLTIDVPSGAATLPGTYFSPVRKAGATAGNVAVRVNEDLSASLVLQLDDPRSAWVTPDFAVFDDGTFSTQAYDLASGAGVRVNGTMSGNVLSGAVDMDGFTFEGGKSEGASPAAGFYVNAAVNGAAGVAYAMVGGDGRGLVILRSGEVVDGGMTSVDANGGMAGRTQGGGSLIGTVHGEGEFSLQVSEGVLAATKYVGLRDDVLPTDRLANISTRGRAGAGDNLMIAGFVVSGNGSRSVLIRAIGPTLAGFGVDGPLADPKLVLYRGQDVLHQNDNWSGSMIAETTSRLGAFALANGSADAAMLVDLPPGSYTAQISAGAASGTALVEVYDASQAVADQSRLINIATRGRIAGKDDTLIAGIVVTGNTAKRILVRAIGPSLTNFGVADALPDPQLKLYRGDAVIRANDNWAKLSPEAVEIAAAASAAGAFSLSPTTADAAMVINLEPGAYTAVASGAGGTTGAVLIEVYEVP